MSEFWPYLLGSRRIASPSWQGPALGVMAALAAAPVGRWLVRYGRR